MKWHAAENDPARGASPACRAQKTINRLKIAEEAAADGITPLEVMLTQMRTYWDADTDEARAKACDIAKDAAPYLHPRLSAVDTTLKDDGGLVVQIVKFAQNGIVEDQSTAEPLAVTH